MNQIGTDGSPIGRFARATSIASSITIILGVITALFQLQSGLTQATQTLNSLKLQALQQVTGLLDKNYEIRQKQRALRLTNLSQRVADAQKAIAAGTTGEDLYLSHDFDDFRDITAHYERLGAIVDLGYLDFDLLFQVIPFPETFWSSTRHLRDTIGKNWSGRDKARIKATRSRLRPARSIRFFVILRRRSTS